MCSKLFMHLSLLLLPLELYVLYAYCSLHEVYAVNCIAYQLYILLYYTIYKYICKKNECVYQPFLPNVT